jgi:hypothetical protein
LTTPNIQKFLDDLMAATEKHGASLALVVANTKHGTIVVSPHEGDDLREMLTDLLALQTKPPTARVTR